MEWTNLRDLTLGRLETSPPSKLCLGGAQPLTWGQAREDIGKIWGLFAERGLGTGDSILVATKEDAQAFELILASYGAGVTVVVVDPGYTSREFRSAFELTDAKLAFIDGDHPLHEEGISGVQLLKVVKKRAKGGLFKRLLGRKRAEAADGTYPGLLKAISPIAPPGEGTSPDTPAYVLMTSGTTGNSKGVPITHAQLFVHIQSLCRLFELKESSRVLNGLPFHHADGLVSGIGNSLFGGFTLYRPGPFTIPTLPEVLDLIFVENITHFMTVPTVLALIERLGGEEDQGLQKSPLKMIISTAGPLSPSLWGGIEARFGCPVANMYGLTETGTGGVISGPWGETRRIGTVGKPVDMDHRVVGDDDEDVAPGETGELLLKGPNVFSGYIGGDAVNDGVFLDGYFRTGDLVSEDDDGFIHIRGRKKSLIIRGGINVYPQEVTEALLAVKGVNEAVTLGVEDAIFGERVVSCVVVEEGAGITPESLFVSLQGSLSQEKRPDRIVLRSALPRGPSGKVRLGVLREDLAAGGGGGGGSTEGLDAEILALAAESFRVPASGLSLESKAGETGGWDSLAHMQLMAAVERHFQIKLSTGDILRVKTLGALKECVARLGQGAGR